MSTVAEGADIPILRARSTVPMLAPCAVASIMTMRAATSLRLSLWRSPNRCPMAVKAPVSLLSALSRWRALSSVTRPV